MKRIKCRGSDLGGKGKTGILRRKLRIVDIVVRQIIKRKTAGRKQESTLGVAVRSIGSKIALSFRKDQQGLNPTHLFNKRNQEWQGELGRNL